VGRLQRFRKKAFNESKYANKDEFVSAFESEKTALYRLALLLTLNPEDAALCLALGLKECLDNSSVYTDWVYTWSRRVVIRTAIRLVMDSEAHSSVGVDVDSVTELAIVDLPDFDRFVFVICALERYSLHDCALLLDRSPRDVCEARKGIIEGTARLSASRVPECTTLGAVSLHLNLHS
jgi:hypothetical protein